MAATGNLWPGVHLQLTDSRTSRVDLLRTDVAAFLGYACRGPLHTPIAVRSLRQFQAIFGDGAFPGYLADSVRAFFDNGGVSCWIVRIDSESARSASADLVPAAPSATSLLTISASSPGAWGNRLSIRFVRTRGVQAQATQDSDLPAGCSRLTTIAGFPVGTHVVLRQQGNTFINSVVQVDIGRQFVRWESAVDIPVAGTEPALVESLQYSLSVFLDGRFQGVTENLSLHDASRRSISAMFPNPWTADATERRRSAGGVPPLVCVTQNRRLEPADLTTAAYSLQLTNGADGLLDVQPEHFFGSSAETPIDSETASNRGLDVLSTIREISMISIPDLHCQPEKENPALVPPLPADSHDVCCCQPVTPPEPAFPSVASTPQFRGFSDQEIAIVQQRALDYCQRNGRCFALLDPPQEIGRATSGSLNDVLDWRSQFYSSYGALYFPWIRISDPVHGGSRLVPPSGFVAGLAAQFDLSVGVHRSPANAELVGAVGVAGDFNDAHHAILNPAGINLIRPCNGRGIRVMGARTLIPEAPYHFVSVRRLMMMIRTALELSTQWAVFEPANDLTRARLKLSVESFLNEIWRRGMLAGNVPAQAYRVTCDDSNNPQQQTDNGLLLMNVEVAPAIPGEFVLLRLSRIDDEQPASWE